MTTHLSFGKDPYSWNVYDPEEDPASDGSGRMGAGLLAQAVQVWSWLNPELHTGDASTAFNCSEANIIQAIQDRGGYMLLGDRTPEGHFQIEHDGE